MEVYQSCDDIGLTSIVVFLSFMIADPLAVVEAQLGSVESWPQM